MAKGCGCRMNRVRALWEIIFFFVCFLGRVGCGVFETWERGKGRHVSAFHVLDTFPDPRWSLEHCCCHGSVAFENADIFGMGTGGTYRVNAGRHPIQDNTFLECSTNSKNMGVSCKPNNYCKASVKEDEGQGLS